jgi:hypothetical protein
VTPTTPSRSSGRLPPPRHATQAGHGLFVEFGREISGPLTHGPRLPAHLRDAAAPGGRNLGRSGCVATRADIVTCGLVRPFPRRARPVSRRPVCGSAKLARPHDVECARSARTPPPACGTPGAGQLFERRVRGASPASWGPSSALQRAHPSGKGTNYSFFSPPFQGRVARSDRVVAATRPNLSRAEARAQSVIGPV